MKILQIVDVDYWAIGKLSKSIVKYNPHFQFKTIYVHPKHVDEHLVEVSKWVNWADIIDYQYWNTARQLMEALPELKDKPSLLTHHNEKDLLSADWSSVSQLVVETKRSKEILEAEYPGKVNLIPLAIDLEQFSYNPKLPNTKTVGYAGRIVPWKGLKEIAAACFELGYTLKLMGKFDKPAYWAEIPPDHQANIDMEFMDCSDEDRINFYRSIDIYVGNSVPGRETGTLPLMEAMASGVPVLTTPSGIAADICDDHENAIITGFGDYESLKNNLGMLMENSDLREKIRSNAWNTIKNFSDEKRAWEYQKIYYGVFSDLPLVSVIVPVYNGLDNVKQILGNLENSLELYNNFEVVICDDGSEDALYMQIDDWRDFYSFPIKYVPTSAFDFNEFVPGHRDKKPYRLAEARNRGVIEAQGQFLFFCDSRMCPQPDALSIFVKAINEYENKKVWLFGDKGANKTSFVENFSMVRRRPFILAGMMNERIDRYGGMSQEIRTRFKAQGFEPKYVPEAKAVQLSGSHMTPKRRADIVASKIKLWKMEMNG